MVLIKEFINKELGHVSYIIVDKITKKALVIDPKRDIEEYINFLRNDNFKLEYVINTHPHADFISGHMEFKDFFEDVKICFHCKAPVKFNFLPLSENNILQLGEIEIKILETPGHTPFCISLLIQEEGINKYLFAGDFLFVGDVGRPDLLGEKEKKLLVDLHYESAKKIIDLDDSVIVLTSHINGSFCGKKLNENYFSSIGIEKKTNKGLKLIKNENLYKKYLKRLRVEKPVFFDKMAKINLEGPILLKKLPKVQEYNYKQLMNIFDINQHYIVDFRKPSKFFKSHILGSINVYEKSNILLILGSLIDIESPLFLVGDKQTDFINIIKRLRRIGFDNIIGILNEDLNDIPLRPFEIKGKLIKTIDLDGVYDKADIRVNIEDVKSLINNLDFNFEYKVFCKNGYKSIAVESFIKNQKLKRKVL